MQPTTAFLFFPTHWVMYANLPYLKCVIDQLNGPVKHINMEPNKADSRKPPLLMVGRQVFNSDAEEMFGKVQKAKQVL